MVLKGLVEKRKNIRTNANGNLFVVFSDNPSLLHHVIDISEGGLSIKYAIQKRVRRKRGKPKVTPYLDIIDPNSGFSIERIYYSIISDCYSENGKKDRIIRRCIAFQALNDHQSYWLSYLVSDNTVMTS